MSRGGSQLGGTVPGALTQGLPGTDVYVHNVNVKDQCFSGALHTRKATLSLSRFPGNIRCCAQVA